MSKTKKTHCVKTSNRPVQRPRVEKNTSTSAKCFFRGRLLHFVLSRVSIDHDAMGERDTPAILSALIDDIIRGTSMAISTFLEIFHDWRRFVSPCKEVCLFRIE